MKGDLYMIRKYIYNFLTNILYLFRNSLVDKEKDIVWRSLTMVEDIWDYDISKRTNKKVIKVMDSEETIDLLLREPKSFCRFGDGELMLIQGKSIPFQIYDEKLGQKLLEILREDNPNFYVGLGYDYFNFDISNKASEFTNKFVIMEGYALRKFMLENCCLERIYIDTGFNQRYINSGKEDFDLWFDKVKDLFSNRDIVVFIGEGTLKKTEFNIFERANSVQYVLGPSTNAFSQYEQLLEKSLSYSKEYTLCYVLGPVSKLLVFDLTKEGYMAWDLGHLIKDYDCYKKREVQTKEKISEYYAPDV